MRIVIERQLTTAVYWMPAEQGWGDAGASGVESRPEITPAELLDEPAVAIVNPLVASRLLDDYLIVRNHAVVASRISALTMVTHQRPDDVDNVVASIAGVSQTGRILAGLVIPEFYGITVTEWVAEPRQPQPDPTTILITEDAAALRPTDNESDYHEDLGRAWFLLTNTPFVSHVCVAPAELVESNRDEAKAAVSTLANLRSAAFDNRRLLRRNLSGDFDVDRETVAEFIDELTLRLDDDGVAGLKTFYARSRAVPDAQALDRKFVWIGEPEAS